MLFCSPKSPFIIFKISPWTRSNTGFTLHFETLSVALCNEMTPSAVADMTNIHADSIWKIIGHYVDEAREKVDLSELDTVGINEISVKKGHQYITLFYDMKNPDRLIQRLLSISVQVSFTEVMDA